jgi:hypothetical protein
LQDFPTLKRVVQVLAHAVLVLTQMGLASNFVAGKQVVAELVLIQMDMVEIVAVVDIAAAEK